MVWLACLAVEAGYGERVRFLSVFEVFFIKTFHQGGLWLRMVTVRSESIDKERLCWVWFYR